MLIVSTTGAHRIGDDHESDDGIFDVDDDTAAHLLAFPGWRAATDEEAESRDDGRHRTRTRTRKTT